MGAKQSLHELAKNGDSDGVLQKVREGADVNKVVDKYLLRPLHVAVMMSRLQCGQVLLENQATVDAQDANGMTPLHYAARQGDVPMLELLLNYGADHTIRDKNGCLPIHLARVERRVGAQERLRDHVLSMHVEFQYLDQGNWYEFDEAASHVLAFELGEGTNYTTIVISETGHRYIVDFVNMLQINSSSWFSRSIAYKVGVRGHWRYPARPYQGFHQGAFDLRFREPYAQALRCEGAIVAWTRAPISPLGDQTRGAYGNESSDTWAASSSGFLSSSNGGTSWSCSARSGVTAADGASPSSPGSVTSSSPRSLSRPATAEGLRSDAKGGALPGCDTEGGGEWQQVPLVVRWLAKHPTTFELMPWGDESRVVVDRFLAGMDKIRSRRSSPSANKGSPTRRVTVTAVHRVHTQTRANAFELYKADRERARGDANERLAWHGAPLACLEKIVLNGFAIQPSSRNGNLYGHGVYLAPLHCAFTSAEFATPDETGEKHVLLCRVILGTPEAIPFESRQFQPSSHVYDTGVDNVHDPTRYIMWSVHMNEYILPVNIVSFRYC